MKDKDGNIINFDESDEEQAEEKQAEKKKKKKKVKRVIEEFDIDAGGDNE